MSQNLIVRGDQPLSTAPQTEQEGGFGGPPGGIRTIVLDSKLSLEQFRAALESPRRLPPARVIVDPLVFPNSEAGFEIG